MKSTCKDCRRQTTQENKTEDSVIMSVAEGTQSSCGKWLENVNDKRRVLLESLLCG